MSEMQKPQGKTTDFHVPNQNVTQKLIPQRNETASGELLVEWNQPLLHVPLWVRIRINPP
jgi:hypothetical protein